MITRSKDLKGFLLWFQKLYFFWNSRTSSYHVLTTNRYHSLIDFFISFMFYDSWFILYRDISFSFKLLFIEFIGFIMIKTMMMMGAFKWGIDEAKWGGKKGRWGKTCFFIMLFYGMIFFIFFKVVKKSMSLTVFEILVF